MQLSPSAFWDIRYAGFCAGKGMPRLDWWVRSRDEAMRLLSPELSEEFAKQYPEEK